MPTIDYTNHEVLFRVAACGPGRAGKTTLLWRLHAQMAPQERGELKMRPIGADQFVSFDCAAPDLIPTGEYRAKLQIFTIAGRVTDPAVWARVMTDVDGIIFVADSQFERIGENGDSLRALATLPGIANVPVVFLYNKRDLPNCAPVDYLDFVLNTATPKLPRFEGTLTEGSGAKAALAALTKLLLDRATVQEEEEMEAAARFVAEAEGREIETVRIKPPQPPPPPEPEPITPPPAAAPEPEVIPVLGNNPEPKPAEVSLEGGCLCGGIRYRLLGLPRDVFHSHSIADRRSHGASPVTWAVYAPPDFVVLRGRAKEYIADRRVRSFCPECGTPLTFRNLDADELLIAAATVDTPELLTPSHHESAAQTLPWPKIMDGLPRSL